jgi:biopolymer transport protein ExbD
MPLKTIVDEEPVINMTPMVDVVFQLIIFFLLATKFTEVERKIGLEIPQVASNASLVAAPECVTVSVYRDGTASIDGEDAALAELPDRLRNLRSRSGDVRVLVRGDAQGQFQQIAEVLNACKQAGIRELGIAVMPVASE